MGCSVEESLNEALRACGACVATGAQRNWQLIQRADAAIAGPNIPSTWQLGGDNVDAQGRIAHVRQIAFVGMVNITSALVSDAISAYNLRGGTLQQLVMEDLTGWTFFQGIDARSLLDELWVRHYGTRSGFFGRLHSAGGAGQPRMPAIGQDEGIPANSNATANWDISTIYPLVRLDADGNPLEGLVTLSSLQLSVAGGLRMRLGNTGALIGSPVGQVLNGYVRYDGSAGMDLWADIVYLPAVIADEPWQVTHGVMQQQEGNLPNGDRRTESLTLRYLPEDAALLAGQALAAQCTGLTFRVGGNSFIPGMTNLDVATRGALFAGSAPYGSHVTDNAALDLPLFTATPAAPLAQLILPFAPRELAAAGSINVQATTRTPTFWRWLHRTVKCPSGEFVAERAAKIYRAAKCGPCGGIFGTTPRGEKTGRISMNRPLIMQPSRFSARKA